MPDLKRVIPPTWQKVTSYPDAVTHTTRDGWVVNLGVREIHFSVDRDYLYHYYINYEGEKVKYRWTGKASPMTDHHIWDGPNDSEKPKAEWMWQETWQENQRKRDVPYIQPNKPNMIFPTLPPNTTPVDTAMYRKHSWASGVLRMYYKHPPIDIYEAVMSDGSVHTSVNLIGLLDWLDKKYGKKDVVPYYDSNTITYSPFDPAPTSWTGEPPTWKKLSDAAKNRKRDRFGRFVSDDDPFVMPEPPTKRRSSGMAMHRHTVKAPPLVRDADDLEHHTIRVPLQGKKVSELQASLRLADFGLYASATLVPGKAQEDVWDVTIRGSKDGFDRWFAEMRGVTA